MTPSRTCSASFGSRSLAGSTNCRAEEIFFETRGGRASGKATGSERLMVDSWMHRACLEPSRFYRYTSQYHLQPETAPSAVSPRVLDPAPQGIYRSRMMEIMEKTEHFFDPCAFQLLHPDFLNMLYTNSGQTRTLHICVQSVKSGVPNAQLSASASSTQLSSPSIDSSLEYAQPQYESVFQTCAVFKTRVLHRMTSLNKSRTTSWGFL